jgi:hypothetical protein
MKKFEDKISKKVLNNVTKSEMEINREEFVTKWKLEHNIPLRKRVVFTEKVLVENKLSGKNVIDLDSPIDKKIVVKKKVKGRK